VTALEAALRQICADLTDAHASFAVVGGLAVSARTEPRFTRDADIAVAVVSDAEAEALVRALQGSGYTIEALVEQDAVGRLATVRLTRSRDATSPVVDLLFASSGIEGEVVAEAETIELLPRLHVRVATTAHLIALKVLARDDVTRPQDIGDELPAGGRWPSPTPLRTNDRLSRSRSRRGVWLPHARTARVPLTAPDLALDRPFQTLCLQSGSDETRTRPSAASDPSRSVDSEERAEDHLRS
jgi:hypothetical protein